MRKNPAIWVSLIGACLLLGVGFGLRVSGAQIDLILNVAVIAIPLIFGGTAVVTRSLVVPLEKANDQIATALAMPSTEPTEHAIKAVVKETELKKELEFDDV